MSARPDPMGDDPGHDELSGHLDDELSEEERRLVEAALASDPALRRELWRVAEARDAVRALPPVDSPFDFAALVASVGATVDLEERRRRRRSTAGAVVTAAAVWLFAVVGLGAAEADNDGTPVVAGLIADHQRQVEELDDVEFDTGAETDLPDRFTIPSSLHDFELVALARQGDGVTAFYRTPDGLTLSLSQHPGRVDWARMPETGRRVIVADLPAWQLVTPTETVLVVERSGMVHAFVAAHGAHLDTMAIDLPERARPRRSLFNRVAEVAGDTVELFGFG